MTADGEDTPDVAPAADHESWAELAARDPDEAERLLAFGRTLPAITAAAKAPVTTRSGVPVTRAVLDKAVIDAAARDEALSLVREGVQLIERGAVEEAFDSLDPARTLEDFLNESDEDVQWHVRGLMIKNAKVLLVAQHKTGKTTLLIAMVKTLADGVQFLGAFDADAPVEGNVVVIDAEMDPAMLRMDYRTAGIKNLENVRLVALREHIDRSLLLRITDPDVQDFWVEYLTKADAGALILDPAADFFRACGLDEDAKDGWEQFQNAVQSICLRANVGTHVVAHHTGWANGRGRGSSRQYDDPDVIITLTKEGEDAPGSFDPETGTFTSAPTPARRLISATGRKVTLPKTTLRLMPNGVDLEVDFGSPASTSGEDFEDEATRHALLRGLALMPRPSSESTLTALSAEGDGKTHTHKRHVTRVAVEMWRDGLVANEALDVDGKKIDKVNNKWVITPAGRAAAFALDVAPEPPKDGGSDAS